jgi:hypothetical protein
MVQNRFPTDACAAHPEARSPIYSQALGTETVTSRLGVDGRASIAGEAAKKIVASAHHDVEPAGVADQPVEKPKLR